MFRKKKGLRVLELSPTEKRLLSRAIIHFRNQLLSTGRPTEEVNEILLKVI